MTIWQAFWLTALIVVAAIALYQFFFWLQRKRYATMISQEDFRRTMHKAQVIDVREPQEFKSAHILGARNIPYSLAKAQGIPGLNRSQPIYLYENGVNLAGRMAKLLSKAGYDRIYILEGGFDEWTGQTKRRED